MKFSLNERVFNPRVGEGTVISIVEGTNKPIKVRYDSGSEYAYTEDGKVFESNLIPSIFREGTKIIIIEPEPKPVFNKGDLVLVWDKMYGDSGEELQFSNKIKVLAMYSHYDKGKHFVFKHTYTSEISKKDEFNLLPYDYCELFVKEKFIGD